MLFRIKPYFLITPTVTQMRLVDKLLTTEFTENTERKIAGVSTW